MLRKSIPISILLSIVVLFFIPAVSSADERLPFYGAYLGTSQSQMPTNDGCPAGRTRIFGSGTGVATHMGTITWTEFVCLDMLTLQFNTVGTMFAANGDQLFFVVTTGQGTFIGPTQMKIQSEWIFNGGTGRFVGATGAGTAQGIVDFAGVFPHTLTGWISNIGQSKE